MVNLKRGLSQTYWDCFPKTNEYKIIKSDEEHIKPPRCIYSPPDHILVGGGTINHVLTKFIKEQPWSAIALNPEELNNKLNNVFLKYRDPVVISMDISNFDRC